MAVRYNQQWEEMDKTGTSLEALFKTCALYSRSEGRASTTIAWYEDKLRSFLRWLDDSRHRAELKSFTRPNVGELILYLHEKEEKHEYNRLLPAKPKGSPATRCAATYGR